MWFVIKSSFWFSLVLVLLPIFSSESGNRLAGDPKVDMADAFTAATGAYDYLSGMCKEKPEVCDKGTATFTALGYRAREGARVAYEFLDSKFKDEPGSAQTADAAAPGPAKALTTGSADKTAAFEQPMPPKITVTPKNSEALVTGTIPLPTPKPVIRSL